MSRQFLFVLLFMFAFASPSDASPAISSGSKVKLSYTLEVDGQVVDQTPPGQPLEYTQGEDAILPALEQELEGKREGDRVEAVISPEEGFGPFDSDAIVEVPKENLPEGEIAPGTVLAAESPEGTVLQGTVTQIMEDSILLDFNHPLAGKELHFDIEVLEVS